MRLASPLVIAGLFVAGAAHAQVPDTTAADTVYVVANPDVPSIRNTQRVIERMSQLGAGRERVRVLLNRMSDQLASSPSTNSSRAGMLVTNVPMNNQPKIRPVR